MENEIDHGNGIKEVYYTDGTYFYKDGLLHREDGPAIESNDGSKQWYKHGNVHREDGPAIEWANGDKYWFLNGIKVSEQEVNALKLKKELEQQLSANSIVPKKPKI